MDLLQILLISLLPLVFTSFHIVYWLLSLVFSLLLLNDSNPYRRFFYSLCFLLLAINAPGLLSYSLPLTYASFKRGYYHLPIFLFYGESLVNLYLSLVIVAFAIHQYLAERAQEKIRQEAISYLSDRYHYKKNMDDLRDSYDQELLETRERDRERIARDLHASIGHSLSASILTLHALEMTSQDKNLSQELRQLEERMKCGLEEVRQVIYELYDQSFDLERELKALLEVKGKSTNLVLYEKNLSHQMKKDLYLLAKECLTNFLRHSSGDQFYLRIIENKDLVTFTARDNGLGVHKPHSKGIGLSHIEEIADHYQAKLSIMTDQGFCLHLNLKKG